MAGAVKSITVADGRVTAASGGLLSSADLTASGVTPGTYTNATVTVDAAGRVTVASNGSSGGVTSVNGFTGAVTLGASDVGAQPADATLTALAAFNSNGIVCQTAADTFAARTLTGPAAGITVSNGNGVSGNPTLALANDLAALEALAGTNTIYYRSAADTWSAVTIGSGLSFGSGTLSNTATSTPPNLLHNGGGDIATTGTTVSGLIDGTLNGYGADRWYALNQTNNTQYDQVAGTLGARFAIQHKQSNVTAQRFGIAQVVEACDAIPYRGRTVRFQVSLKVDSARNVRIAIVEWTGTADSVTRDVVLDWTSGTYTAGNFFTSTNTNVVAASGSLAATTSFQTFSVSGTVGSAANNLVVLVWTEGTVAQNGTLVVTECGLYDGNNSMTWLPRALAAEQAICGRFRTAFTTQPVGLAFNGTELYNRGAITFNATMRTNSPSLISGSFTANVGNNGTLQLIGTNQFGTGMNNSGAAWTASAVIIATAVITADL